MMRLEIPAGTRAPAHYGVAYSIFDADKTVYYPVPLHLVGRHARNFWFWFRYTKSATFAEKTRQAAFLKGRMQGYQEGRKQGQQDVQENFVEVVRMGPHSLRDWLDKMGMEITVKGVKKS